MSKTYNLFISHSWNYGKRYDNLISLLDGSKNFSYRDYSVPKDDPIHDADNATELRRAIKKQMMSCHVVIVVAGVDATYSKWIDKEIDLAKSGFENKKSILAIEPHGSERTSGKAKDAADKVVKWNTESIVSAIRELA